MATNFSAALQPSNSTDALFRAWVQFVHDTFIATGLWVDTGDTGQLTIGTALHPTLANTKVGYRTYRMADTLQATAPIFVRVDFGSGSAANRPGMWFTIGGASNGAGTITSVYFNGGATVGATITCETSANVCNSYGSADTNRLQLLMFTRAGGTELLVCSLERTKSSVAADTADGLIFVYSTSIAGADRVNYIIRAAGSQPPAEVGVSLVMSNAASSAFAGDLGVGIPIPFKSVAQQPGLGLIAVNSGDLLAEATPNFTFYGSTHTYQLTNNAGSQLQIPTGNGASTIRGNTRLGIRYE